MSFARLVHPPRRAYSSFFSSKPGGGGGRYFNSAKPPKVIVPAKKVDSSVPDADPVQTSAPATPPNADKSHSSSSEPSPSPSSTDANSAGTSGSRVKSIRSAGQALAMLRHHPVVTSKDFKLHQFFSLHRPLLLLSHPLTIFESSPTASFDPEKLKDAADSNQGSKSTWLLDEFSVASADADAAAARQLSRALTMNHAGAAVAWEDTLRRLGLDLEKDTNRIQVREQMDREWEEVMMDSTKRKRRKKMKKHKLKKRRKATRATRLKIGR